MLMYIFTFAVAFFYLLWIKSLRVKSVAIMPNSIPILGHLNMFKDVMSLIKNMADHSVENGITTFLLGPLPIYVIADPGKAKVVLNTCLEKLFVYKLIQPLAGDLLIAASVPKWKHNRHITDLAFKPKVLEGYMGAFNAQAKKFLKALDGKVGNGYVDLTDDITDNILETTCQTTMGLLPFDQQYVNKRYVKAIHKVFEITTQRLQKPWMMFNSIFHFCKTKTDLYKNLNYVFETSSKMVELRKSEYLKRTENNISLKVENGKPISYLEFLIEHSMSDTGSFFTDLELRYLCDNVLVAAFDTVTYQMLFMLVCIGSDLEVQRKIYEEIAEVLGNEEIVRKEHLHKLRYLEAAIKETTRLYPIAPLIGRQSTENFQLDNLTFPASSYFLVHLWAINRNKKYWGLDAEEFKPDRWLNPETMPDNPNAFGSFSFGRRRCIGRSYTMMHMKTTLVPILRKYLITADHKKMEFSCYITLKVVSGHLMKFELR